MQTPRGSYWFTLYRYEKRKLVIIHEPLKNYQVGNLIANGWKRVV